MMTATPELLLHTYTACLHLGVAFSAAEGVQRDEETADEDEYAHEEVKHKVK